MTGTLQMLKYKAILKCGSVCSSF